MPNLLILIVFVGISVSCGNSSFFGKKNSTKEVNASSENPQNNSDAQNSDNSQQDNKSDDDESSSTKNNSNDDDGSSTEDNSNDDDGSSTEDSESVNSNVKIHRELIILNRWLSTKRIAVETTRANASHSPYTWVIEGTSEKFKIKTVDGSACLGLLPNSRDISLVTCDSDSTEFKQRDVDGNENKIVIESVNYSDFDGSCVARHGFLDTRIKIGGCSESNGDRLEFDRIFPKDISYNIYRELRILNRWDGKERIGLDNTSIKETKDVTIWTTEGTSGNFKIKTIDGSACLGLLPNSRDISLVTCDSDSTEFKQKLMEDEEDQITIESVHYSDLDGSCIAKNSGDNLVVGGCHDGSAHVFEIIFK